VDYAQHDLPIGYNGGIVPSSIRSLHLLIMGEQRALCAEAYKPSHLYDFKTGKPPLPTGFLSPEPRAPSAGSLRPDHDRAVQGSV